MKNKNVTLPVFFDLILEKYNPWWRDGNMGPLVPPPFRRPVFGRLYRLLTTSREIITLTGPRRVGKTVLLWQLIQRLLGDGVDPRSIIYFSLDDPVVHIIEPNTLFHYLTEGRRHKPQGPAFLFLDEVQSFPGWELFAKREYDLKSPWRLVVSGSAATPIFRVSRESLLGRVKDIHLAPFSFLEYILYNETAPKEGGFSAVTSLVEPRGEGGYDLTIEVIKQKWESWRARGENLVQGGEFTGAGTSWHTQAAAALNDIFTEYLIKGGFPAVWQLEDAVARSEYLVENHVRKVIREDLLRYAELRKTDSLETLFYYLLTNPGREFNLKRIAGDLADVSRSTLSKFVDLLTETELVFRVRKFSRKPYKLREGNFKVYLADHSISSGLLKISDRSDLDNSARGFYVENVLFNLLRRLAGAGVTGITYYRDADDREIDFVVSLGLKSPLPIEVRPTFNPTKDRRLLFTMNYFIETYNSPFGLILGGDEFFSAGKVVAVPVTWFLTQYDPCF